MATLDISLRGYYQEIRSYLPCSRRQKNRILDKIHTNVQDYLEEHPETDFAGIQARFGDPQAIAAAYVDEMGTDELFQAFRVRRKIVTAVTAGIALIVLLWASALGLALLEHHKASNGQIIVVTRELTQENQIAE